MAEPAGGDRTFTQLLNDGLAAVGNFLYGSCYLLSLQILASTGGALYCAFETRARDRKKDYWYAYDWAGTIALCELITVFAVFWYRVPLKQVVKYVKQHYGIYCTIFRGIGIVSMLRLFVFVSDLLGREKNLDGFSTAFFFLAHLHVASVSKLLGMDDLLFLSDSLLAIAIMIAGGLDGVSEIGTAILDHHVRKNVTTGVDGAIGHQHGVNTIGRSLGSYFAATACVLFRLAKVPFEQEEEQGE